MSFSEDTLTGEFRLLEGVRVAFWGKLGGFHRREAQHVVRQHGGVPVDGVDQHTGVLVIGADELPWDELADLDDQFSEDVRQAAAEGRLEIVPETTLWERLGMVEAEQNVRRLYTPAMLAGLIDVPVATVRRWHRRGLIVPARMVHRLPYFDFQEVSTARRLAQLLAAGASPADIERKLAALARYVPDVQRPLAQLSVIVEGKQILLREGEGLVEPGGQLRFDFVSLEHEAPPSSLAIEQPEPVEAASPGELVNWAARLEEEGDLDAACEAYHAALAAGGPDPEICFQLAEALYRQGRLDAAAERYYMAIELDEDYVEARANLGCVLAETGQMELAAAAFEGALTHHDDYPDVHFHLARALDEMGEPERAEHHWQSFLSLSPDSPWADEARHRLAPGS